MSNVAFDLEVFKLVSKDPAFPVPGSATALAALASIGPDLYQHVPLSSDLSGFLDGAIKALIKTLTPAQIQNAISTGMIPVPDLSSILNPTTAIDRNRRVELFEKPLMAAYSVVFQELVIPFWPIFQNDADWLNKFQTAANNQD